MLKGIPRLKTVNDLMARLQDPREFTPREGHLFLVAHSKLSPAERERVTIALTALCEIKELMSPPANSGE